MLNVREKEKIAFDEIIDDMSKKKSFYLRIFIWEIK